MPKRKHILILNIVSAISGAERSLLALLETIDVSKYNVTILLPQKQNLFFQLHDRFNIKILPLVNFRKSYSPFYILRTAFNLIWVSIAIARFIKKENIDIVIANSLKANVYTYILKTLTGIKTVCFVRDNISTKKIYRVLLSSNDQLVCVSEFIRKQIPNRRNNATVIYPAISMPRQVAKMYRIRQKLELTENIRLVAAMGQLTPWKNLMEFITIAELVLSKNQSVHFIIAGDAMTASDSVYKKKIERRIAESDFKKHFSMLGFRNDIESIFKQIDILVHCALREPFGRSIAEAMFYEKPVVAFDSGGPREITLPEVSGFLVQPGNLTDMANKVSLLLCDEKLRASMGKNGKAHIQQALNTDQTTSRIESILDALN